MNSKIKFTIIAITFLVSLGFTKDVFAATQIFRSVGPGATAALASNTSPATNTITISNTNSTATFVTGLADNIGVGDAIVYDSDNSNTLTSADSIAFIHGRTSSTVYTIKTQAGASPTDLTANDTWAIYRAYTSLANAESGTKNSSIPITTFNGGDRDLVTNNEQWNIACYANGTTADATAVTIDGWNTDSDNFIRIYTPILSTEVGVNQRHIGKWDNTKYYLSNTSANSALEISDTNALIDGLQIDEASSAASKAGIYFNTAIVYNVKVSNNIIKGSGSSTGDTGIKFEAASAGSLGYAYNNIVYDFNDTDGAGIRNSGSNFTTYFYNNTVYGISGTGGFGISQAAGTVYVKNDVVQSSTDGYNGTFDASSDYNISDLAADAPGTNSKNSSNVEFVNETGRDFHLAQSDTQARQAGANLTADTYFPFPTDIDGQLRNPAGAGWDIGADEGNVEFVSTVMQSGGNFSTLSSWEDAIDSDLVADTTRVFAHGGITGTIVGGNTVTGLTSGATATVVYTTSTQILLSSVSGVFQSGETVQVSAGNSVVISDNGNPASAVAKIDGPWTIADTVAVPVGGWTTGPDNYIKIYTTPTARHSGKWDMGKYRLVASSSYTSVLYIGVLYAELQGLQIERTNSGNGQAVSFSINNSNSTLSNSIIKGINSSNSYGVIAAWGGQNISIINNIFYGFDSGIYDPGGGRINFYNNTFYNCIRGIWGNNTAVVMVAKNNITQNCSGDDFSATTGAVFSDSSHNISSDSTAPGTNSKINTTVSFISTTSGAEDFHLAQSDTGAKDAGTDLSSYFTTDIDGATRTTVTAWDIGADETATQIYRSVGPSATGLLDSDNSHADLLNSITSGVATFEVALVDNIGVGDVLIYDSNASETITSADTLLFIHGRTDSTHYTVRTQTGAIPSDVAATNDTWQIYRAHISLANAEAGTINSTLSTMGFAAFNGGNRDLMINNEEWNITCYANGTTSDSNGNLISGWNTGVQNFIKVYTPVNSSEVGVSQRHNGKWDESKWYIKKTDDWGSLISVDEDNVTLDGLQIGTSASQHAGISIGYNDAIGETGNIIITNCILFRMIPYTDIRAGINIEYENSGYHKAIIGNCIIEGFHHGVDMNINSNTQKIYIHNNTVADASYFIYRGTSINIRNNLMTNVGYFMNDGAPSASNVSHLVTDGTVSFDTSGFTAIFQNQSINFIDPANHDFHLSQIDTSAKDKGTDLSAYFTTDIDGATRTTVTAWDIGADETATRIYRSVGPSATGALATDSSHANTVTLTSGVATFSAALADIIGVGDVVLIDTNGGAGDQSITSADTLLFISGRNSPTSYNLRTQTGAIPSDITINDTYQIYRAHTSLSLAEAGTINSALSGMGLAQFNGGNRDILTNNEEWNIACYANGITADSTAVTVQDWGTGANNGIKIYTPAEVDEVGTSQRHNGVLDINKYRMYSGGDTLIAVLVANVKIEGIQIASSGSNNHGIFIIGRTLGNVYISKNLISAINASAIQFYSTSQFSAYVSNNIIYNSTNGVYQYSQSSFSYYYNNTIINTTTGFTGNASNKAVLINNVTQNCVNGYNSYYSSSDYNISDIAGDAPNASFAGGTANVLFVDEANDDFRLSWDDTAAKKMGLNLSADANLSFTDDIRGQARPKSPDAWSIGACENLDKQKIKFEGTKVKMEGDIKFE